MTPARPRGPAGAHREPARAEPIAYAALATPADCYVAALSLLAASFPDEAHAVLTSGADAGFPACRAAAEQLERDPPNTHDAHRIVAAALEREEDSHA